MIQIPLLWEYKDESADVVENNKTTSLISNQCANQRLKASAY